MPGEIEVTSGAPREEVEKQLEAQGYEIIRDGEGSQAAKPEENVTQAPGRSDEEDAEETEQHPESFPKKKGGFQKRIDKLTREKREMESRIAALEQRLESPEKKEGQKPQTPRARPVAEKFANYEEYLEALTDWKVEQREAQKAATEARAVQESRQREEAARQQAVQREFHSRVEKARDALPDFDDVTMRDDVMIPPSAAQAIVEADNGPEIMYYLGQNPRDAENLQGLSAAQQAIEIGKLSYALSKQGKPSPRSSKAPAPVKTVSGNSARSTVKLDEMDYQDFKRAREAGAR